jgi:hypothetical protein
MQVAKAVGCARAPWRRGCQVGAIALAMALTTGAWAGTASGSFSVTVDLRTTPGSGSGSGSGAGTGSGGGGGNGTGICLTTPESPTSVASIDCHTDPLGPVTPPKAPQARQGQALRFLIPDGNGDERYGGVDLYAGTGTITSWRVVHLTDWDYLEMTVGW